MRGKSLSDSKCLRLVSGGDGGDHSSKSEMTGIRAGSGNVVEMLLSWIILSLSGRWSGVTIANTFVDLLCSRHCSKYFSYIGVFVI